MSNFILKTLQTRELKLNTIRLRGFYGGKLRKGSGGGGSGDGFPQLPGDVTRWYFGGLTNEMMAAMDDPRIEDADGKGRFLSFKNFAWKGMSGVGGYAGDFSKWMNNRDTTEIGITESNSKVIIDVKVSQGAGKNIVFINKSNLGISNNVTIKITSTYPEGVMKFANSASNKYLKLPSNGVITLQDNPEYTRNEMYLHLESGDLGQITIEQLPLYPGFILGDGVDDFAVTENNLDLEDTYTIYTPLILLKYGGVVCGKNSDKDFSLNTVIYSKSIGFDSANAWSGSIPVDLFEFVLVACKRSPQTMYVKDLVTGKSNQNKSKEFVPNPRKYFVWRNVGGSWCQVAIAGQIICNGYYSTDEDDEKVLDWYKKQYPWLFFDQAWTVVGKTNEDEDRATIANITGNGNDLVLSNFGFAEGSGYNEEGEYAGYLVTDGVDDQMNSRNFDLGKDFTIIGEWKFMDNIIANAGITKALSLFVYNTNNGLRIFINNTTKGLVLNTKTSKAICSDGRVYSDDWSETLINEEQPITNSKSGLLIGINGNNFAKIALKNLAIYNQILSKEDCIKAYIYLQTLKAK